MILSYRFRLYPTKTQKVALTQMLGSFCDLYNAALEQRITAYQRRGVALGYADQALELKAVRSSDDDLGHYSFSAQQQVLRRLNKAFGAFFRRVKSLHGRVANQRRDFSHKLSKSLVQRFTHLAFEDLNIKGLARGMHARSVHDAAWSQFLQHVRYKAESAGSIVCLVDPRKTSQTCPECDAVAAKSLSDRVHTCGCGCTLDRDVAAARVILKRANFCLRPGHPIHSESDPSTFLLRSRRIDATELSRLFFIPSVCLYVRDPGDGFHECSSTTRPSFV